MPNALSKKEKPKIALKLFARNKYKTVFYFECLGLESLDDIKGGSIQRFPTNTKQNGISGKISLLLSL